MSPDPHAQTDQAVLDQIEQNPVGAVPHTPTHQDALRRLLDSHQVYASADHKEGHVTARSLANHPVFHAANLDALIAGQIDWPELEDNDSIFTRYAASLPEAPRAAAEAFRLKVVGRPIHHRKHHDGAGAAEIHDPEHTLFLVPGGGLRHGLPGNYLHGSLFEVPHPDGSPTWSVQLHDSDDGAASFDAADLPEALATLRDVLASAPFHLNELEALGFKSD